MLDFDEFEALTFDCYGTLIDWERAILAELRRLFGEDSIGGRSADELLELFGRLEADAESGPYRTYRKVLSDVALGFGRELGLDVSREKASAFAASVAVWPPFDDSVDALRVLGSRYRLAIVSNVDDDLFHGSAELLRADFAVVVTAQQVRSYKPAHDHFRAVTTRLGLSRRRILHVAQSLYHDIAPARELGIACVRVNRREGRTGGGATRPTDAVPDLEVPDLVSLVGEMGLG